MKRSLSPAACAFWALLAADLALSLQPRGTVDAMYSPQVQSWDSAAHFALHAALGAFACAAFVRRGAAARAGRLAAALALACLGAALELLQAAPWVGRSCTVSDAALDAAGALAGAFALPARFLRRGG
ncbi:MAG: VanZ family protein [Kiritimatiellae bacterium]|nr:VanZ family protein [Kiritimatiellia bacterium]